MASVSINPTRVSTSSVIQNSSTLQSGATAYPEYTYTSSATVSKLTASTLTVTDVFSLDNIISTTWQDISTVTYQDGVLLDMSGINNSVDTEGLRLPQSTDCSAATAEGQICWDTSDHSLFIGTGTSSVEIPNHIFVSTFNSTALDGFKIYASTGAIAANTSITITIPGTTQIWFPLVSELEGVNTVAVSVRIKSVAASSYVIYNADALNAKNYSTWVFAR